MSKKQSRIHSFFKPKAKDQMLASESRRVNSRSLFKNNSKRNSKNVKIVSDNVIISLLSSDDEEMIENKSVPVIDPSVGELKLNVEKTNQMVITTDPCSHTVGEVSDEEFINSTELLEVMMEETEEPCVVNPTEEPCVVNPAQDTLLDATVDCKLNNFRSMIEWVLSDKSNDHLFNQEDWVVIENFTSMSDLSQRLYVRLYVRKHRWIRSSKITYPELGDDLKPLIDELVQKRLLLACEVIDNLEEVLQLLDPIELRSCAKSVNGIKLTKITSKQALIDAILRLAKSSQSITNYFSTKNFTVEQVILNHVKKMLGSTAFCVDENSGRLFSRMSYLFYPPRVNEDENGVFLSQQLFNQLKVDNGELSYPKYKINKKEIIYKSRQDLILFEIACRLENQILVAVERKDFDVLITKLLPQAESGFHQVFSDHSSLSNDAQLPSYLRNQTKGHVFVRCLNHLVSVLEQQKDHEKAVEFLKLIIEQNVYCQYYKGKWIERLAIDLEKHLKKPRDALQEIVNGLDDPAVKAGFRYSIYQRGQRLAKSLSTTKVPIPFNKCSEFDFEKCPEVTVTAVTLDTSKLSNGRRNIFTSVNEEGDITCIPVEEAALRHYKRNGYSRGLHSEGTVYHALLNLLLWDVIYADLDDAFRTCSQSLPLDFTTEYFHSRRAKQIDNRLCEIRNYSHGELALNLEQVWAEHFGTSCLISWDSVDIQDLKDIAYCMGNQTIVAIFERLCHHFRFTHSGFPDLLVWNVETKMIKAVEVKGPNDSLSSKQILWMQYFIANGFPTEVCYVKSASKR